MRASWPRSVPARRAALALACGALLGSPAARAGSPEAVPVSPEAALTAGAVLASDDLGGGGWYNPASLGAVRRKSIQVGASAYAESATFIEDAARVALPWGATSGDIRSLRYASVPSVLSFSFRVREGVGLSIGLWTPYHDYEGGTTTLTSAGVYPGTALNATFAETYAFTERRDDTWGGVGVGWQATSALRVGAMLQGVYATDVWTVDVTASLQTDSADPLQAGAHLAYSERGDRSVLAGRTLLGLQWDATRALRLAAALRGPTIRVYAWGPVDEFLSAAVLLPGLPPAESQVAAESEAPHGLASIEPVRVYAGLRYAGADRTLALEADWHPALVGQFGEYEASGNARLGATWRLGPNLVAGAGLFYEGGSSEGTASSLEMRYAGFTGGLIYRPRAVVDVRQGGDEWDLLACVAVRGAYGWGTARGIAIAPADPAAGALAISFPDARSQVFQGSISFLSVIAF